MSDPNFFICRRCNNLVVLLENSGFPLSCCGEKMEALVPNAVEASVEKHIPVVQVSGNKVTVTVGSVIHPMLPEHFIQWIVLQTKNGILQKNLKPGDVPSAEFFVSDGDEAVAAFDFCNLHGLWKKEI
ncbi:MAG: desulfoferrodoxin family protein [Fibrobacteraceae bacterium]